MTGNGSNWVPPAASCEAGEIYLVSLDPTEGHEQQGTRPVLVVSADRFNEVTRVPIVLPITSGGSFARTAGFAVSLAGAGTRTTGIVRCDQPRPLDLAARRGRRLERVPPAIMDEVLARLLPLFRRYEAVQGSKQITHPKWHISPRKTMQKDAFTALISSSAA